jgi:hypothetical protein
MDNITLNDEQMELLKEYKAACENFRKANETYNNTDVMSDGFNLAKNRYGQAFADRNRAASIFADSVAESIKEEVIHA